ncbi:hypothetical protein NN561_006764 [Cricetulus griseus]
MPWYCFPPFPNKTGVERGRFGHRRRLQPRVGGAVAAPGFRSWAKAGRREPQRPLAACCATLARIAFRKPQDRTVSSERLGLRNQFCRWMDQPDSGRPLQRPVRGEQERRRWLNGARGVRKVAGPRLESAAAECADVAERTYQWEGVRATPSLARPDFTAAGRGLGRELREEAARQKPARLPVPSARLAGALFVPRVRRIRASGAAQRGAGALGVGLGVQSVPRLGGLHSAGGNRLRQSAAVLRRRRRCSCRRLPVLHGNRFWVGGLETPNPWFGLSGLLGTRRRRRLRSHQHPLPRETRDRADTQRLWDDFSLSLSEVLLHSGRGHELSLIRDCRLLGLQNRPPALPCGSRLRAAAARASRATAARFGLLGHSSGGRVTELGGRPRASGCRP